MNCDQVFQYLTSTKPDQWNGQLDRHMAGCESCRMMADLFRPAVALFGDLPLGTRPLGDASADAPRPWEQVWEAVAVAERAADQLRDQPEPPRRRGLGRAQSLIRTAALIAAGVLVGGLLSRVGVFSSTAGRAGESGNASAGRLLENARGGRCENLVLHLREAAAAGACPTCNQPIEVPTPRSLALCMTCHRDSSGIRPDPLPARQSSSDAPFELRYGERGTRG